MRPRHKAAENFFLLVDGFVNPIAASMRPRHKAAENYGLIVNYLDL